MDFSLTISWERGAMLLILQFPSPAATCDLWFRSCSNTKSPRVAHLHAFIGVCPFKTLLSSPASDARPVVLAVHFCPSPPPPAFSPQAAVFCAHNRTRLFLFFLRRTFVNSLFLLHSSFSIIIFFLQGNLSSLYFPIFITLHKNQKTTAQLLLFRVFFCPILCKHAHVLKEGSPLVSQM